MATNVVTLARNLKRFVTVNGVMMKWAAPSHPGKSFVLATLIDGSVWYIAGNQLFETQQEGKEQQAFAVRLHAPSEHCTHECILEQSRYETLLMEWLLQYPLHCQHCHAEGGFEEVNSPYSPNAFNICDKCLEKNICPLCHASIPVGLEYDPEQTLECCGWHEGIHKPYRPLCTCSAVKTTELDNLLTVF